MAAILTAAVEPAAPLTVACSGGPDSVAALVAVARSWAGTVTAAHFDHRLRAAAEVACERELVRGVALATGAGFVAGRSTRVPPDRGEAAAREARYRWLARTSRGVGAAACVTGHTLDDQAETVILRLVRGAGQGGAAGMLPVAPWPVVAPGGRALRLVRPLLGVGRAEVETYIEALGVEAARDPSNDTLDYARNRIRLRVMPELRALNPRAAERLAAFAARARSDDAALEMEAARQLGAIARRARRSVTLDRQALLGLPAPVATRVVRQAAAALGIDLDAAQPEAILHAARARGRRVALGGGLVAARRGPDVVIGPAAE